MAGLNDPICKQQDSTYFAFTKKKSFALGGVQQKLDLTGKQEQYSRAQLFKSFQLILATPCLCRHGFLSTRLNFPNLLGFGVALFFNACNEAKLNLVKHGVPGGWSSSGIWTFWGLWHLMYF